MFRKRSERLSDHPTKEHKNTPQLQGYLLRGDAALLDRAGPAEEEAQRDAALERTGSAEEPRGGANAGGATEAALDRAGPAEEPCGAGAAGDGGGKSSPRRSTALKKMPPEPFLELDLLRQAELEDMVVQGRESAIRIVLEAGFFKGLGWRSSIIYATGAFLSFCATIYYFVMFPFDTLTSVAEIVSQCATLLLCFWAVVICAAASYFGWKKDIKNMTITGTVGFSTGSLCMAIWGVTAMWLGFDYLMDPKRDRVDSVKFIGQSIGSAGLSLDWAAIGYCLYQHEFRMAHRFFSYGGFYGGFVALCIAVVTGYRNKDEAAVASRVLPPLIWVGIAVWIIHFGWSSLKSQSRKLGEAHKIIEDDKATYDTTWNKLCSTLENQGSLQELTKLIEEKEAAGPQGVLAREVQHSLREAGRRRYITRPIQARNSLAVLFAQAAAFNEHFQEVVRGWAAGLGAHVQWCSVKRRSRAIEKLFHTYGGQADHLIDLVRSGITFPTIRALMDCLSRIFDDERVAVLQVKNRLNPAYDSNASAGYRNVALNLCLVDEFTAMRLLDTHIAELQLGLQDIDALKHAEGHKRYVTFRNATAS